MAKTRKFSVRLLKSGKTFKESHKQDFDFCEISRDDAFATYISYGKETHPWWRSFLGIKKDLLNKSNAAILTVKAKDRIFVYTFGSAHNQLKQECFEENFGFLVTINSIDGEKLKSIDLYSPASNTKQKRVVSSILSNIYEYDFDDSKDLVQKIAGVIKDEYKELFTNPTGTDSLSIHSKSTKDELKEVSEKLLDRFYSEDYKNDPYLKDINKIKKASIEEVHKLNRKLLEKLNNHDFSDIYMADAEILDQTDFYLYKFGNREFHDLSIGEFVLPEDLTIEKLKTLRFSVLKSQDDSHPVQWNLYKCLVFEQGNIFLSKGVVYEIEQDFLKEINDSINKHKIPNFLPNVKQTEREDSYNRRVCDDRTRFLLDKKCLNIEGYSKIEICDIYDKAEKSFIHIKKAESSSSLSHLWNQGVVSEQLANSKNKIYRTKFKQEVSADVPEKRKIYYGIIKDTETLPIFSKISLFNTIKLLKSLGKEDDDIKYFYIGIE